MKVSTALLAAIAVNLFAAEVDSWAINTIRAPMPTAMRGRKATPGRKPVTTAASTQGKGNGSQDDVQFFRGGAIYPPTRATEPSPTDFEPDYTQLHNQDYVRKELELKSAQQVEGQITRKKDQARKRSEVAQQLIKELVALSSQLQYFSVIPDMNVIPGEADLELAPDAGMTDRLTRDYEKALQVERHMEQKRSVGLRGFRFNRWISVQRKWR